MPNLSELPIQLSATNATYILAVEGIGGASWPIRLKADYHGRPIDDYDPNAPQPSTSGGALSHATLESVLNSEPTTVNFSESVQPGYVFGINRNATYSTSSVEVVNAALNVCATNTNFANSSRESGITVKLDNYANFGLSSSGELVAIKNSSGATRALTATLDDTSGAATLLGGSTSSVVTFELQSNGEDLYYKRVAVDVVNSKSLSNQSAGVTNAGIGIRVRSNQLGSFSNGVVIESGTQTSYYSSATGLRGIELRGVYSNSAIDLSNSTTPVAIRSAGNQWVSLDSSDTVKFRYSTSTQAIEFYNGASRIGYLTLTGRDAHLNSTSTTGGGTASFTRDTFAVTSGSIAPNNHATFSAKYAKGYMIMKLETSTPAWVRVYSSAAALANDAARAIGTDPDQGSGVLLEVVNNTPKEQLITPGVYGFNSDPVVSDQVYIRMTNISTGTISSATVLITALKLEA